ncbi:FtsX-like permease family protein [Olivibacter sp. XZL3]|uniref:ABC transporter permease n=1 Tax=Olivibacter sp. XZL3 TaxID=1735116 RepID=UPI0010655835|nr:FtsX-like permease family protein [Olivibacter sp. XZL3]
MILNYFKAAWRNMLSNRLYSLVNICGLSIGLATAVLLLLWVQDEKSYDQQHKDYERIYKINAHFDNGEGAVWEGVPGPLFVYGKTIPGIESMVRIYDEYNQIIASSNREKILDGFHIACVDSTFFNVFDFPIIAGNPAHFFSDNKAIALTESMSKKFFGNTPALGKVLQYYGSNFTVKAVLADFPTSSSLRYDALVPMGFYEEVFTANGGNGDWKTIDQDLGNYAFSTFVKLQKDARPTVVSESLSAAYKKARNGDSSTLYVLQNLSTLHLIAADGNDAAAKMVQIFFLVAILVLAIAAINYINLSTARALTRAHEVSIRKIVGAPKFQLFLQFILETCLLFVIALSLALAMIVMLMPLYNQISGKDLSFSIHNEHLWKVIGFAALGTLVASSIYPAILLSSFHPIKTLRGKYGQAFGTAFFRKALVIFQFCIAIMLIVATITIGKQLDFIRQKDVGFDKTAVFTVGLSDEVSQHADAIVNELIRRTDIINVSQSEISDIHNLQSSTSDLEWQGKPQNSNFLISQATIDKNFIPTMNIQLLEGANLTGTAADSNRYIVNERAVEEMGLEAPYIGQELTFHGRKGVLHGIVKDFNFRPLREKITPLLFFSWWRGNTLYVRSTATNISSALKATASIYKKYAGNIPFNYKFVDEQFEEKYRTDQRTATLFTMFAGIAIAISCLGLFGLATYTARVRTKEVGVRKVLGASVVDIMQLFTKESVRLILLSVIIASPLAWLIMYKWLENYAYRTPLPWWSILLAGFAALLITIMTVGIQAFRAASANPVDSLKEE